MAARKEARSAIAALSLAVVALLLVALACTPERRHAVLAFLVDGVPPYLPPEERARVAAEAAAREAEEMAERERMRLRRYRPVTKLGRFTHGPYASKECGRCHDLTAASGFLDAGGPGALGPGSVDDLAEGGRLRMPVTDLCVHCHTDYASDHPVNTRLWMHGPVASGWCVACHQSHSSNYPHLVKLEPTARLCGQCHLRGDLLASTPDHRPGSPEDGYPPLPEAPDAQEVLQVVKDCTRCHDPHRGPNRSILKERPPSQPEPLPPEQEWHEAGQPAVAGGGP